jgi:hypothetical protein
MTAEMEAEMDQIAAGEMTKDQVLADSRDLLRSAYDEMGGDLKTDDEDAKWRKFAREIWAGMDEDRILGPCIVCQKAGRKQEDGSPNMLRIIKARKSGKRFVGCQGWDGENPDSPDSCDQTFPMPQPRFYDVHKLEEVCSVCGKTPRVSVAQKFKPGRPWKLCFNDDCPSMEEMKRRRAEREAAREAKEEAVQTAEDGAENGDAAAEAEKIAAQASATKVKPARRKRGSGNGAKRTRAKAGAKKRTRAKS